MLIEIRSKEQSGSTEGMQGVARNLYALCNEPPLPHLPKKNQKQLSEAMYDKICRKYWSFNSSIKNQMLSIPPARNRLGDKGDGIGGRL